MSSRKQFFSGTAWLFVMTFAQYVFPLITLPYLTRVFEPGLYGVVTYMTATTTYFRIFIKFGFDLSSTKTVAEHRDDKAIIGATLGSTMQASAMLAAVSLAVYTALAFCIPVMRGNMLLAYLYLAGVIAEILLPDYLFLGLQRMSSITLRYIVARTVSTAMTFILVRSKRDVLWVPALNIAGSVVAAATVWYQILFSMRIKATFSRWGESLKLLRVSAAYFVSKFATTAFGATNTLLLGIIAMPEAQISYWGLSYSLITTASLLYTPIINSLYPHMIARRDTKLVRLLLGVLMPLIVAAAAGCFLLARPIIMLAGDEPFLPAVPVFRALLPVLVFSFPAQVLGFPVLGTIGKVKETTKSTIIAAIFHISGLLALLIFGVMTIFNMAVLRSFTEALLFGLRGLYVWKYRRYRQSGMINGGVHGQATDIQ